MAESRESRNSTENKKNAQKRSAEETRASRDVNNANNKNEKITKIAETAAEKAAEKTVEKDIKKALKKNIERDVEKDVEKNVKSAVKRAAEKLAEEIFADAQTETYDALAADNAADSDSSDSSEKSEKSEKSGESGKSDKSDMSAKSDNAEKTGKTAKPKKAEKSEKDKENMADGDKKEAENNAENNTSDNTEKPEKNVKIDASVLNTGRIKRVSLAPKISRAAISEEEKKEAKAKKTKKAAETKPEPRTALGRWWRKVQSSSDKISFAMCVVTMGVVYGDIGTSPLYVAQSFVAGQGGVGNCDEMSIVGMLSLLFWTVTLITTVEYVLIALRADNKGEGGIFSLFSLVRKYAKWLWVPAMVGGAAFLADSVFTPAVSIVSAVEGLESLPVLESTFVSRPYLPMIIALVIIVALFSVQSRGTEKIGKVFGVLVIIWFSFLAIIGIYSIGSDWWLFKALNPVYAARYAFSDANKAGIAILGSLFLSVTGAEALYSDMGHVGRGNIYMTWPFIKISLMLNYFGQGAWMLRNRANPDVADDLDINPFFQMMPMGIRYAAVILSVIAGIIASQALITGSFSMISESTGLNWWPHLQVRYPSRTRGQLYIPSINFILCVSTCIVLLIFQTAAKITEAYGLALSITMICAVILLVAYLWFVRKRRISAVLFGLFFTVLHVLFFVSSMSKFISGGWFTMIVTTLILFVMYVWNHATKIERSQRRHVKPEDFLPPMAVLHQDESIPKMSDNVIYLTSDPELRRLDTDIFYSIFADRPKKARAWWVVSVQVTDEPFTREYSVENFGTDFLFRVRIRLGFKVGQNVATYLHQIMHDLINDGTLPAQETIYPKLDDDAQIGTINYVLIHKDLVPESNLSARGISLLRIKYAIRSLAGSPVEWFGLKTYNPVTEVQPLFVSTVPVAPLKRVKLRKTGKPITLEAVLNKKREAAAEKAELEADKAAKAEKADKTDKADKADKTEKAEKAEKTVK